MTTPQIQKVIAFNYIGIKLVDVTKILFYVKIYRKVEMREEIMLIIKYISSSRYSATLHPFLSNG